VALNTATVLADATKSHPGRSNAAGAAQVSIQAAPTVQRFVVAQALTGSGRLYAETTINRVVASNAGITTGVQLSVNTVGIVNRPATAAAGGSSTVSAVATHVNQVRATLPGGGYAVFAEPYLFIGGLARVAAAARLDAAAIRMVQSDAMPGAAAGFLATAVVSHGSAAALTHARTELSAKAIRSTAAHALAACEAGMDAQAVRSVFGVGGLAGDSWLTAGAGRTVYASMLHPGSTAGLHAGPDITIREAGAKMDGVLDVVCDPYVTRPAHAIALADSELVADAVRVIPSQAEAQTEALVNAEAVRVLEAESWALVPWCWFDAAPDVTVRDGAAVADSYCAVTAVGLLVKEASSNVVTLSETSSEAVRRIFPQVQVEFGAQLVSLQATRVVLGTTTSQPVQPGGAINEAALGSSPVGGVAEVGGYTTLAPVAHFVAVPDITTRQASAAVGGAANGYGEALVVRMVQASMGASSDVMANADRSVSAESHFDGRATLAVVPIANPFSFDPESRTFYRQAGTTNFVRSVSITEFRRPA
jgi:hypothetical protein